jgi:hypothetical protein
MLTVLEGGSRSGHIISSASGGKLTHPSSGT